jgi:hypothetical protein
MTDETTPAKRTDGIVRGLTVATAGYSLWKQLIEKLLTFALFFQIIRGSFLDESLQVIGVLLHARQQVVEDVATLIVTARKQVNASVASVQLVPCVALQFAHFRLVTYVMW